MISPNDRLLIGASIPVSGDNQDGETNEGSGEWDFDFFKATNGKSGSDFTIDLLFDDERPSDILAMSLHLVAVVIAADPVVRGVEGDPRSRLSQGINICPDESKCISAC